MAAIQCASCEDSQHKVEERCQACTGMQCKLEKKVKLKSLKLKTTHGNNDSVLPSLSLVSFLADAQMAKQNAILFTKSARL